MLSLEDWVTSHDVVLDKIDVRRDGWPEPVRTLAAELDHLPLPGWVSSGPHPFTSSGNKQLSETLLSSSPTPSSYIPKGDPLAGIFNTVLSTSAGFQHLARLSQIRGPMDTVSLWSSLVAYVTSVSAPDAAVTPEAWFAYPRFQRRYAAQASHNVFVSGVATLLVSLVHSDTAVGMEHYKYKRIQDIGLGPIEFLGGTRPIKYVEKDDKEDDVDDEPVPGRLNLHILTGIPSTAPISVPIVCMADKENILQVMASSLYQRRALNIAEPVIGILFSRTGSICRVLYGWLDNEALREGDLPLAHVVAAHNSDTPHTAVGMFDLSDATSAIAFANYLLSAVTHFDHIRAAFQTFPEHPEQDEIFSWRADQDFGGVEFTNLEGSTRIAEWVTRYCANKGKPGSSKSSKSQSTRGAVQEKLKASPSLAGNVAALKTPSAKSSASKSDSKKSAAASDFAKRSGSVLSKQSCSIIDWMEDMRAEPIARIRGVSPGMNSMVDLYNNFTTLYWPTEWTSEEVMPETEDKLKELRSTLWEEKETCQLTEDSGDETLTQMLASQFSEILLAMDAADDVHRSAETQNALETEHRQPWDRLLKELTKRISTTLPAGMWALAERTIGMPNPLALEIINRSVDEWYDWRLDAARQALYKITSWAHDEALVTRIRHFSLKQDDDTIDEAQRTNIVRGCQNRADDYPVRAICDITFAVALPNFLQDVTNILGERQGRDFAKDFAFVQQASAENRPYYKGQQGHPNSFIRSDMDALLKTSNTSRHSSKSQKPVSESEHKAVHVPFALIEAQALSQPNIETTPSPEYNADLLIPFMVVEYKRRSSNSAYQAGNQHRLYAISAVRFLQTIGVTDIPVFGLIAQGSVAVLACTWYSSKDDCIYVMDRNLRGFDIATVVGTFHFSQVFIRLAAHAKKLQDIAEQHRSVLLQKLQVKRQELLWKKKIPDAEPKSSGSGKSHDVGPSNLRESTTQSSAASDGGVGTDEEDEYDDDENKD
ncbi:hypothetical protein B0H21DRAFT_760099 [Amylocystis lapponica]|nr:hypothetical protein B0H21DRAFT_760099 [Amylocystis lapponica]